MSAPDQPSSPAGTADVPQGARGPASVRSYESLASQQVAPTLSPAPSMLSPRLSTSHDSSKSLNAGDRIPLDVVCVGLACVDIAGRPIRGPLKVHAVTLLEEVNLAGIVAPIEFSLGGTQRHAEKGVVGLVSPRRSCATAELLPCINQISRVSLMLFSG